MNLIEIPREISFRHYFSSTCLFRRNTWQDPTEGSSSPRGTGTGVDRLPPDLKLYFTVYRKNTSSFKMIAWSTRKSYEILTRDISSESFKFSNLVLRPIYYPRMLRNPMNLIEISRGIIFRHNFSFTCLSRRNMWLKPSGVHYSCGGRSGGWLASSRPKVVLYSIWNRHISSFTSIA